MKATYDAVIVVSVLLGSAIGFGLARRGLRCAIRNNNAFSARTSLRLKIKLGPDSVFEKQLK